MGQQGFGIELRVDDEQGGGCSRSGFDVSVLGGRVEVEIEGAIDSFAMCF